jgi:hypothetical protein
LSDKITPKALEADMVAIGSAQGKALLNLNVVDGVLVAEYDPKDLDKAAQVFVDRVLFKASERLSNNG